MLGVASGADDYLSKPFSGKELVTRVATQIRLKRLRQQAFDAIAASEQRLRLAQDAGRIGAWQFDPRDETISSQGSLSRLWGLEDSLSLGNFINSVHVEDRARFERALMATARDGSRLAEEFRLVRPDTRELVWLAARAERQVDGSGSAPLVVGVAFDITEQRLAETQLRQLNEYLKAKVEERTADRDRLWSLVGDLMLVARFDANIVAVNPAFTNVLGWKPEEMIGRKFLELVHPDDLAATEAEAARLATGAILHRFENRYRSVSGEWRWIAWTAAPDSSSFTPSDATLPTKGCQRRSSKARKRSSASAEDGSGRPVDRRHRARLQQPSRRGHRQSRTHTSQLDGLRTKSSVSPKRRSRRRSAARA